MNARLALAFAAFAVAPAAVSAAQPTTTPSNQPAPQADPPASANAAVSTTAPAKPADTTCNGKGYEPRVEHPSAQVGKDTGWIPPKRKRPVNADCAQAK